MKPTLGEIRDCLEGAVPLVITTCAPDGTPNTAYLSQAHYVDDAHLALSFQFFNRTRQNVLANPRASVLVVHPDTAAIYRLAVEYTRTETSGALFESMKAKLSGIASQTGMADVFRLRGSDVYRVIDIEDLPGAPLPATQGRCGMLARVRACVDALRAATDLESLLDAALDGITQRFGYEHAMVLMLDAAAARLYTVASRGYPASGVGWEIALGDGVIGVAAREGTPIRIMYATTEYTYGRAMRESARAHGMDSALGREIAFPGLADARSQIAVPIAAFGRVLGVLYLDSAQDMRFGYDDEDALVTIAAHIGAAAQGLQGAVEVADDVALPGTQPAVRGAPLVVRHYAADDSIFMGDDYLIKGVAGAVFWKLARDYVEAGRTAFSNRELRLDPTLGLPDITDNLEARLILLERRLIERAACVRIEKTARGRFRLQVNRPLQLVEVAG